MINSRHLSVSLFQFTVFSCFNAVGEEDMDDQVDGGRVFYHFGDGNLV